MGLASKLIKRCLSSQSILAHQEVKNTNDNVELNNKQARAELSQAQVKLEVLDKVGS